MVAGISMSVSAMEGVIWKVKSGGGRNRNIVPAEQCCSPEYSSEIDGCGSIMAMAWETVRDCVGRQRPQKLALAKTSP